MAEHEVVTALESPPSARLERLYERLAPRVPALVRLLARLNQRLPPASRLRRLTLAQLAFVNLAAYGRGELDLVLLPFMVVHNAPRDGRIIEQRMFDSREEALTELRRC